MHIIEFKNNVNLIIRFVNKMNEENVPDDTKKFMLKFYANTLRINLSDRMTDSIIESTYIYSENTKQVMFAL